MRASLTLFNGKKFLCGANFDSQSLPYHFAFLRLDMSKHNNIKPNLSEHNSSTKKRKDSIFHAHRWRYHFLFFDGSMGNGTT